MLPLHLIVGYALGWTFATRDTSLQALFAIGLMASLAWGGIAAITTNPDGDRISALVDGGLLAAANVIVGAIVGVAVTARVSRP